MPRRQFEFRCRNGKKKKMRSTGRPCKRAGDFSRTLQTFFFIFFLKSHQQIPCGERSPQCRHLFSDVLLDPRSLFLRQLSRRRKSPNPKQIHALSFSAVVFVHINARYCTKTHTVLCPEWPLCMLHNIHFYVFVCAKVAKIRV